MRVDTSEGAMKEDSYIASLLSEIQVAASKVPVYTDANAIWHCGRIAYLAYSISRYISHRNEWDIDTEADWPTVPMDIPYE